MSDPPPADRRQLPNPGSKEKDIGETKKDTQISTWV